MALQFEMIHLLAVVSVVAVCCALCMSRSQAIERGHRDTKLVVMEP